MQRIQDCPGHPVDLAHALIIPEPHDTLAPCPQLVGAPGIMFSAVHMWAATDFEHQLMLWGTEIQDVRSNRVLFARESSDWRTRRNRD
jgi:hypothetical protein